MFDINLNHRIASDLPVITDNYEVLHYDEYPILFTGTNKYGNKLLGSFSYEDDENNLFRYFVIILGDRQFSDFYSRKISYRDLILESKEIFIVDKDINDKIIDRFLIPLNSIPADYLPLESSFIPENKTVSNSLSFTFSLKGKLADMHKALVSDINNINQKIYGYLEESLEALNVFDLQPKVYSQPSQIGSYRLNFDIEFQKEQTSLFPIDQKKITEFINGYLNYVAYILPNESDAFLEKYTEDSRNFIALKNSFEEIFRSSSLEPISTISDILIDNINSSAEKLSEVTEYLKYNNSFNAIEVGKISDTGNFTTVGYLIEDYKISVESKLLSQEELLSDEILSDNQPKLYRILVFRINRETGKGGARLYFNDSEDFHKIQLNIVKEDNDLSNSTFTMSLNENKVVTVKGVATSINGIYKKLECYI